MDSVNFTRETFSLVATLYSLIETVDISERSRLRSEALERISSLFSLMGSEASAHYVRQPDYRSGFRKDAREKGLKEVTRELVTYMGNMKDGISPRDEAEISRILLTVSDVVKDMDFRQPISDLLDGSAMRLVDEIGSLSELISARYGRHVAIVFTAHLVSRIVRCVLASMAENAWQMAVPGDEVDTREIWHQIGFRFNALDLLGQLLDEMAGSRGLDTKFSVFLSVGNRCYMNELAKERYVSHEAVS